MRIDELRKRVSLLPDSPGVYRFYDGNNQLIYVGKAKSIKKRVASYFAHAAGLNRKTTRLVSEIAKIEYTVSTSEFDALLLENNLIKQNQPKYNILLKDDKTFPYLCILRERFPRIIATRKYIPQQGEYFGPYASVVAMKNVLELVRKLYTIRTCNLALTTSNIEQNKFKVCLEFHIGNCKGPCENLQTEDDYNSDIEQARNILKGDLSVVQSYFKKHMQQAAEELTFERAQFYKEKLQILERFQSKSLVVNRSITNIDVTTITSTDEYSYINYLQIKEGAIIHSKTIEIRKKLGESDDDLLAHALVTFREQCGSINDEVYSNVPIHLLPEGVRNVLPKIGDKKKLISLSLKNALEMQKERELLRAEKRMARSEAVAILQQELRLPVAPAVIECFDNSNFQGASPVASMVRFQNGKPDRKNYRHYNIKTVQGPDDFGSMKEIIGRRYSRIQREGSHYPDLIVVDGGKGQLSSAVEALKELGLYGKIPVVGIAKKLEEIFFPEDPVPLHLSKKSQGLLLLQHVRNEAHRFAIAFHRKKRGKAQVKSELEGFNGIGPKTMEKLLQQFKSIRKIKAASFEDLREVVGENKARLITDQK